MARIFQCSITMEPWLWNRRASYLLSAAALLIAVLVGFARPAATAAVVAPPRTQLGLASYYGPGFHGEETASGRVFNQWQMVAAHRTLPFGSVVRVTNLENGRTVVVRIIDRGPYGKNYRAGTIIDLSKGAARRLRSVHDGIVRVRIDVLKNGGEPTNR
jgi:rare lipoprotein A